MKFRSDINGLRAYAVLFVVLFHFGIYPFSGGFVGVDIFFVISGYLMTRIIIEGIESGKFSIWKFYFSRCRRIIPPLLFLCFILLVLGYFFIPPAEYTKLSKHVFVSLTFISNMAYFREAGYFDAGSIYKWLLHTWSLSVEWQFYLVLPVFLLLVSRFFKRQYKAALILTFILSFLLALFLSQKHASLSYFFFGTRAWEMIAGGLAYITAPKNMSRTLQNRVSYLGILILLLSAVFINESVAWPGVLTLIPVVTTALIIAVNGDVWLLNNKVVQKIGSWSYSIYLYHWPVLVASGIFIVKRTVGMGLALTVLSVFLGWLSYTLVENKKGKIFTAFSKPALIFPSLLALAVSAGLFFHLNGLPEHAPARVNKITAFSSDANHAARGCFVFDGASSPECKFGVKKADDKVDLVVIGDSHSYATLSSVVTANPNAGVVFIAQSSCPTVPGIDRVGRPECGKFMQNAFNSVVKKYKNASVLFVNRFSVYFYGENGADTKNIEFYIKGQPGTVSNYFDSFSSSLKTLGADRKIFILSPIPDYPYDVISHMSRNAMLGMNTDIRESVSDYKKRSDDVNIALSSLAEKNKNVHILEAAKYLCDSTECYGNKNDTPLYRDSNHLSETGNKVLLPLFKGMWSQIN